MAEINGGIECPFCGAPTVMGTMLTVYAFRAKHRLSKSGIALSVKTVEERDDE